MTFLRKTIHTHSWRSPDEGLPDASVERFGLHTPLSPFGPAPSEPHPALK